MMRKVLIGALTVWILGVFGVFAIGFVQKQASEQKTPLPQSAPTGESTTPASGAFDSNSPSADSSTRTQVQADSYTLAQVAEHASMNDCWLIVEGSVYNVTGYLSRHPGGAGAIIPYCGYDATDAFTAQRRHGMEARSILAGLKVGSLKH